MKRHISRTKGFTLIELMVVISIVAMLSSVVLASTASAKAKGRDGLRTEQVHQMDLGVQLYASNYGHPPYLTGCAAEQNVNPDVSAASACVAVSTAGVGTPGGTAWSSFKTQLATYIPNPPSDPCGTCTSGSAYQLGYTYVAPLALKYSCISANGGTPPCPQSDSQLDQTYQLYAPLERQSVPFGIPIGASYFNPIVTTYSLSIVVSSGGQVSSASLPFPCVGAQTCNVNSLSSPPGPIMAGTQVTVTATPDGSHNAWTWGGSCASFGSSPSCTFTINSNTTISVVFGSN